MKNRIVKPTLPALVAGAMFVAAGFAGAQQPVVQGVVVGSWTIVSETAHQGGRTTEPLGPHPLGSLMFDRGGRFMLMIARPGLPKFAANRREAGTPEDNRAVLGGSLAIFGTGLVLARRPGSRAAFLSVIIVAVVDVGLLLLRGADLAGHG